MADTAEAIAYEAATRALSEQRASLDNLRSRAATLLSASAIVTSFLGAAALSDTTLTRATGAAQFVPDRSLEGWELVAIIAFGAVLLSCMWILRPRGNWNFVLSADWILGQKNLGASDLQGQLATWAEKYWDQNAAPIKRRMYVFQLGVALLFVEALAWLLDLTT